MTPRILQGSAIRASSLLPTTCTRCQRTSCMSPLASPLAHPEACFGQTSIQFATASTASCLSRHRCLFSSRASSSTSITSINSSTSSTSSWQSHPHLSPRSLVSSPPLSAQHFSKHQRHWKFISSSKSFHSSCFPQSGEKSGLGSDKNVMEAETSDDNSTTSTNRSSDLTDELTSTSEVLESTQSTESLPESFTESFADVPGTTHTQSKKLVILYTCKVCNTRSAKQFTENAYLNGVVLVRCPGCQNLHLIADRLGMFEDKGEDNGEGRKGWDVEKALKEAGENVRAVSGEDVLELTMEDVLGTNNNDGNS